MQYLDNKKVYFDTNPLIYFLEKDSQFFSRVLPFFQGVERQAFQAVASHLVIAELLVKPLRQHDKPKETLIRNFLLHDGFFKIFEHNKACFELATAIRAEKNLKMVDALHVATAIVNHCDYFLTYDEQIFNRIDEINVIQI